MLNIQALVLWFEMERFTLLVIICDFIWKKKHIVWAFERQHGFTYQFGFYIENMYKQRTKVFHNKFQYLTY